MEAILDGPASPLFSPIPLRGNYRFDALDDVGVSKKMADAAVYAHLGKSVAWGISFNVRKAVNLKDKPVHLSITPTSAEWFAVLHCSDVRPDTTNKDGSISPIHGVSKLNEHAADYIFIYEDGSEGRVKIHRRHKIGSSEYRWDENCTRAVPAKKPRPQGVHLQQSGPMEW